jgi:hypothetical protein
MQTNPYAAPNPDSTSSASLAAPRSWSLVGHGIIVGSWTVLLAAVLTGGLTGLMYRCFRDVAYGGDGYFGMLKQVGSHLKFFVDAAIRLAILTTPIGLMFGLVEGAIARSRRVGAAGVVLLAIAGAVLAMTNCVVHMGTNARFVRYFAMSPLPGLIAGGMLFGLAGRAIRSELNRLREISRASIMRRLWSRLGISLIVVGIAAAAPVVFRAGWYEIQVVMQFAALIGISTGALTCWIAWKTSAK